MTKKTAKQSAKGTDSCQDLNYDYISLNIFWHCCVGFVIEFQTLFGVRTVEFSPKNIFIKPWKHLERGKLLKKIIKINL